MTKIWVNWETFFLAHIVDGLAHRPERRYGHEFRLHTPSGGAFRVIQRAPQPHPLGKRQLREDFVTVFLVEVFENVDGIVRIEIADSRGNLLVRHLVDNL